jgi:N-acetylmuramoyl-L-alanine amidase
LITREKDEFVSLEERGKIANDTDPDENTIFISIHANASFNKSTFGYETYFLSLDPIDEAARDVASMENSVLTYETDDYSDYLTEIINRIVDVEYRRESMKLAENIQKSLRGTIGNDSADRGVKSAFFYVLKASKMPAVLVEIGFLTNKDEVLKMIQSDYQKRIARGIAEGINDFILLFRKTEGFTKSF